MDICRAFGHNVRVLRESRSWSQEQLAEVSGLHRTYISGIERGVRNPTLTIVETIARAFGVPPSQLLQETDES